MIALLHLVLVISHASNVSYNVEQGEVYLDEGREFMKALGDRWLGVVGLLYPSVWKNGARAKEKYPTLEGGKTTNCRSSMLSYLLST